MRQTLGLHEGLLLLALHDRKGTVPIGSMVDMGLGGGLLAELVLAGRVEIQGEGRKRLVAVVDTRRFGDELLDEALKRLREAKRRIKPATAVHRLGRLKQLRHRVARDLCRRGVLRATEDQILLLFRRRVYPTVDPGPERTLVADIRGALDAPGERFARIEERTAVLVGLAHASRLLGGLYGRSELRALKPRLQALREMSPAVEATWSAVEATEAATVAAIAAAS
ncbi:MAG: GPP34 family phosphoprotein [Gemmatimonadota bacterium]|nr:GPP34 family phosphoprotein [Gemmatimonadota bacterium]